MYEETIALCFALQRKASALLSTREKTIRGGHILVLDSQEEAMRKAKRKDRPGSLWAKREPLTYWD